MRPVDSSTRALSLGLFIQEQGALPALVRFKSVFSMLDIQSVLMKWWEWSKFSLGSWSLSGTPGACLGVADKVAESHTWVQINVADKHIYFYSPLNCTRKTVKGFFFKRY